MSLITRCPACTTLFKVVPDQLRVSEGWVRCGQCDEVFDANIHLQGGVQAPLPPPISSTASVAQPHAEVGSTAWQASAPLDESDVDTEPQMPVEPTPELEQELAAKLEWPQAPTTHYDNLMDVRPGAAFDPAPALNLEIPDQEPDLQAAEIDAVTDAVAIEPQWEDLPLRQTAEPSMEAVTAETAGIAVINASPEYPVSDSLPVPLSVHGPTFMRKARGNSYQRKPWIRRSLAVFSLLLLLSLCLQVTLHERDRIATRVPELRPFLIAICEVLECQIAPFKQIDSVVIDASAFIKVRGDSYRLNLTLKNTALFDVAAPAIELTLTDTQDQPMIRHVLSATELGAQQGTLAAGGELISVIPLNVKTAGSVERISGYRLLAFYP